MKKFLLVSILAIMMVVVFAVPAMAIEEYTNNEIKSDHKVQSKWDLAGSYTNNTTHFFAETGPSTVWNYEIHVKEAASPSASVGSLLFTSGLVSFEGKVEYAESNYTTYSEWAGGLMVAGTGYYDGAQRYFMALFVGTKVWLALSDTSWTALNGDANTIADVYAFGQRLRQTHSNTSFTDIDFAPKFTRIY